jgi:hypothetical protein
MRSRRQLVTDYAEFVAACRIRGVSHLLKGAPSIEAMRVSANRKIAAAHKKGRAAPPPFPELESMVAQAELRFRQNGIPDDIRERLEKWLPLKREELANG